MSLLNRLIWKSVPRAHRQYLLQRLSVVDRQAFNKVMQGNKSPLLAGFKSKNCIFVHVPKCAGTSVCQSLFGTDRPGHLPLSWYEMMYPEFYAGAFKFAFVRDPLERALSAFNYLREERGIARDAGARRLVSRYACFDDFVIDWLCAENAVKQIHFAPQWHFLVNGLGQVDMDFIGKQENISSDFVQVCRALDVEVNLSHTNRSQMTALSISISDEARSIVAEVYRRDYQLFGYTS